jgi:hypothetical protein
MNGTTVAKLTNLPIGRKKAVADHVIGAGEAWLTELSTADIKQLFALRQEAVS